MNTDNLREHNFYKQLLVDYTPFVDCRRMFDEKTINKNEIPDLEHYIRNSAFYALHLLELCNQLERAVKLLYNFRNDKKEISRGHHLTYNIENYFIRLDSVLDRTLQAVNAIFNFGLDESKVKKFAVFKELEKVEESNRLASLLKDLGTVLFNFSDEKRNTIVHRHSYLDNELIMLEMYYNPFFSKEILEDIDEFENFKQIRKEQLSFYLRRKEKEFKETNVQCFEKIFLILNEIAEKYSLMKQKLRE